MNKKTQGFQKLLNYFEAITQLDDFQKTISIIRKKLGITPKDFHMAQWQSIPSKEIKQMINDICDKFHLHREDWGEFIHYYIIYNEVIQEPMHSQFAEICYVTDENEEKRWKQEHDNSNDRFTESDKQFYPVKIKINPYASERDIVDFIKNKYKKEIEPRQKDYQNENIKIGSIKKRRKRERDNFIYNNRNKSRKEIIKLLVDRGIDDNLDEGSVGKIISIEKQRRKKL